MSELVVAESKGLSREIRTKVTLFPSGLFPVGPVEPVVCDAIWDTGAYGSSISERAAKALDLIPVSSTVVHTAKGDRQTPVYQIDLMLPNNVRIKDLPVTESDLAVCDALIGMDVITLGDMGLTNLQNTRFMFRIPAKGNVPIGA